MMLTLPPEHHTVATNIRKEKPIIHLNNNSLKNKKVIIFLVNNNERTFHLA